jgi:excisionase family DNA binding protein
MCNCLCMTNPPAPLDLVGSAEAARLLGVDRSTLTRWVASDRIKVAHRMPGDSGALLFERAEVERVRTAERAEPETGRSA